jgi:hypothetical protein
MNKYELMWEKNAVHNPLIKHAYAGEMLFDVDKEDYTLPISGRDGTRAVL